MCYLLYMCNVYALLYRVKAYIPCAVLYTLIGSALLLHCTAQYVNYAIKRLHVYPKSFVIAYVYEPDFLVIGYFQEALAVCQEHGKSLTKFSYQVCCNNF